VGSDRDLLIKDWWAEPVKAIYREAVAEQGGDTYPLQSGPGHIAWADDNFSDEDIGWCLAACESQKADFVARFGESSLAVARRALERLLHDVPEAIRDCDPYCD
jgi:hypothetical protein